jgi:hypothetical protein
MLDDTTPLGDSDADDSDDDCEDELSLDELVEQLREGEDLAPLEWDSEAGEILRRLW